MEWAEPLVAGNFGVLLAVGTVLVEFGLAIGLWNPRTRAVTVAIGIALHVTLTFVAAMTWDRGLIFLVVLNFGLVAMYPTFWVWRDTPPTSRAARYLSSDRSSIEEPQPDVGAPSGAASAV